MMIMLDTPVIISDKGTGSIFKSDNDFDVINSMTSCLTDDTLYNLSGCIMFATYRIGLDQNVSIPYGNAYMEISTKDEKFDEGLDVGIHGEII